MYPFVHRRNQILSENHEPEYQLIKPVPISENTIFEEKAIITAFNEYVPLKNASLKVSQHNDYVTSLRKKIEKISNENYIQTHVGVGYKMIKIDNSDVEDKNNE